MSEKPAEQHQDDEAVESSTSDGLISYAELYRRTARRTGIAGAAVAVIGTAVAALAAGGPGLRGGLIGAGTVLGLTGISCLILLYPWDRRPLLAGVAPAVSFVGKLAVVIAALLAFAHEGGYSHVATFAVIVAGILVTMLVESLSLASRRAPVVESDRKG